MEEICKEWKHNLGDWLKMLNEVEIKALKLSMASFECGTQANIESSQEQRLAHSLFCDACNDLRSAMIRELE